VPAQAAPDYDREVRPILSDHCYKCHGPDAETREADLRLDTREGLVASAVIPGQPDASELVARITSDDPEMRMPPPEAHLDLSADQKQTLRAWIAAGAEVTEHWAFRPVSESVAVPAVRDASWPRETLDRFVLAKLESMGRQPAPPADAWRLVRRLSLDFTGLPPTPEEIAEFETDARQDLDGAIASAVDRLLASDAFGEHLAVAWLDVARYADSYGYQSDQLSNQWPYRDWVVRALNDNLPYNQFITWQLAGDLLPDATRDQRLATAFNRLHRMTNEGGSIAEEWLVENSADRVHTMGSAMLGLTLECARCHDHKFDPILARDYYSLFAFFNSIDENGMYDRTDKVPSPSLLLPTDEQQAAVDAARREIEQVEEALAACRAAGEERFAQWRESAASLDEEQDLVGRFTFDDAGQALANLAPNATINGVAPSAQRIEGRQGSAIRFNGDRGATFGKLTKFDRADPFTFDFWLRDAARNPLPVVVMQQTFGTDVGFNGVDLMLADGLLEARIYRVWPGNAIGVRAVQPLAADQWQHMTFTYDGASRAAGLKLYADGVEIPTQVLRDRIHKSASAAMYGDGMLTFGERMRDRGFKDGQLDELRIYARALTPLEIKQLHDGAAHSKSGTDGASNESAPADISALREYYFSAVDDEARALAEQLHAARHRLVEAEEPIQEVAVMEELPEPRPTYLLARGAYDAPKGPENRVDRDVFQEMLNRFPSAAPHNRLGLAQWMTDSANPLPARVVVNRVWASFFGRGLVASQENFGRQGTTPSHPELLDWLARDFIDHGWDLKRLCRQIATSGVYRQDSRATSAQREADPDNQWLARGPSRRLSAEQIRDVALAASGLLDRTIGGPPVSPYQPGGDLWRESNSMSPAYQQSTGRGLHRRSIYSVWKRTSPLPNMMAFDAVTREVCTVSRSRTNTPLQALVLLNDVQFVEAARSLAAGAMERHADLDARINDAFMRLAGRPPDALERELLVEVYDEQHALFVEAIEQDPAKFLGVGESKPDATLAPADLAALTAVCQVILNLDATIFER